LCCWTLTTPPPTMMEFDTFQQKIIELGIPKFRAAQIFTAIFKEGKSSYREIAVLPQELRESLSRKLPILSLRPEHTMSSSDGSTIKTLLVTADGHKIESVLLKFRDGRNSVCVSSQIGCQMGCVFCATGKMKFGRNLTSEEIADQVLYFSQMLAKDNHRVSNVIYMGMGEPFMNYDNVIASVKMLNNEKCLNIGIRNITLSTSGLCEGIDRLADSGLQVNLAVSLHAPTQEIREKIMPIARKYKMGQLMEAINSYLAKTNRRVTYEYIMLKGINDSDENARQLVRLIRGQLCHVNLIPYNATGTSDIKGSTSDSTEVFKKILTKAQIPVTIRVSLGQDIMAACGQLAITHSANTHVAKRSVPTNKSFA
jgi:23S rRNA (adenine2503-C2)-methyltransferase